LKQRNHPKALEAILLTHDYFWDFKCLKENYSIRPGYNKGEPEVKDLRALMYDPSSYSIYFKLIFDEPYSKIPQKRATRKKNKFN